MFKVEGTTISITRGDEAILSVMACNEDGSQYTFKVGDVVRISVYEKNNYNNLKIKVDTTVTKESNRVDILLTANDTKIDEIINKPVDLWYEVQLNPETSPQTFIGYDEDGAKIFRLYPEGADSLEG